MCTRNSKRLHWIIHLLTFNMQCNSQSLSNTHTHQKKRVIFLQFSVCARLVCPTANIHLLAQPTRLLFLFLSIIQIQPVRLAIVYKPISITALTSSFQYFWHFYFYRLSIFNMAIWNRFFIYYCTMPRHWAALSLSLHLKFIISLSMKCATFWNCWTNIIHFISSRQYSL